MGRRQFSLARQELLELRDATSDGVDQTERLLRGSLAQLVESPAEHAWLEAQREQLILDCDLQASRELTAQVPIDFTRTRELWDRAIERARQVATHEEVGGRIAEIAIGRGKELFRRRKREERLSDSVDRRGSEARSRESIALMTLAWQLTGHRTVQGPLAENLYRLGAIAWRAKRLDDAFAHLLQSLRVRPSSDFTCDGMATVVVDRRDEIFDEQPDKAGSRLLEDIRQIEELDPEGTVKEIGECVKTLRKVGPVVFFKRSQQAAQEEEWGLATDLMIWCLRIHPDHPRIAREARDLAVLLERQASSGDGSAGQRLERLRRYLPERSGEEDVEEMLRDALADAKGEASDEAMRLIVEAGDLAQKERFEEAMDLAVRALRAAPGNAFVLQTIREIGRAWSFRESSRGRFEKALQILAKVEELTGDG